MALKPSVSRINAQIPTVMLQALQRKAVSQATSVSELLRHAIGLTEYIEHAQSRGAQVIVDLYGVRTAILPRLAAWPISEQVKASGVVPSEIGAPVVSTLARGARGDGVARLQVALKAYAVTDPDADPGAVDGIFGPRTESAVRAYQAAHGVDVDGVVADETWTAPAGAIGTSLAAIAELTPVSIGRAEAVGYGAVMKAGA
jgi:murein L,D-transpeptidase YcbB/YkuD